MRKIDTFFIKKTSGDKQSPTSPVVITGESSCSSKTPISEPHQEVNDVAVPPIKRARTMELRSKPNQPQDIVYKKDAKNRKFLPSWYSRIPGLTGNHERMVTELSSAILVASYSCMEPCQLPRPRMPSRKQDSRTGRKPLQCSLIMKVVNLTATPFISSIH